VQACADAALTFGKHLADQGDPGRIAESRIAIEQAGSP
jgi:hypothetical protein